LLAIRAKAYGFKAALMAIGSTITGYRGHRAHKIDYVKGKVAFDLEWNGRSPTVAPMAGLGITGNSGFCSMTGLARCSKARL
jgi:hypothetical protein